MISTVFRINRSNTCASCGKPLSPNDPQCPACGALNEGGGWVKPGASQCGNCHAGLGADDKYCRICGTKRGEGAYAPYQNLMQCIYGPPPVNRKHTCPQCGFSWTTCVMIDRQEFCPQCGSRANVESEGGDRGMFLS